MLRDTCDILSTPAGDVHVRLKTTSTEIKIAKETTNNQDKSKYHGGKYGEWSVLDARAKLFGYNINPLLLCRFCCRGCHRCLSSLLLSFKIFGWQRQREW